MPTQVMLRLWHVLLLHFVNFLWCDYASYSRRMYIINNNLKCRSLVELAGSFLGFLSSRLALACPQSLSSSLSLLGLSVHLERLRAGPL